MSYYVGQELYCHEVHPKVRRAFTKGKIYVVENVGIKHDEVVPFKVPDDAIWTETDVNDGGTRFTTKDIADATFIPLDLFDDQDVFEYKLSGEMSSAAIIRALLKT